MKRIFFRPTGGLSAGEDEAALANATGAVRDMIVQRQVQAQASSLSQVSSELRVKARELESEFETDPVGFDAAYNAHVDGVAPLLPENLRDRYRHTADLERRMSRLAIDQRTQVQLDNQNRVNIGNGLSTFVDQAARASNAGDLEGFALAQNNFENLLASTDLFSPMETDQYRKEFGKQVEEQHMLGVIERSSDRLGLLEGIIDSDEYLPEEKDALIEMARQITEQENFVADERERLEDEDRQDRHDLGAQQATVSFLEGSLNTQRITDMLRNDELNPTLARTLNKALDTEMTSDLVTLDVMLTDPLLFDNNQIMNAPLSTTDKRKVMDARRAVVDDAENWRNSQPAHEGARRIRGELGLVGAEQIFANIDDELARRVSTALTEWYARVESFDVEQRPGQALALADEVVEKIRAEQVDPVQAQLESLARRLSTLEEGSLEHEEVKAQIEQLRDLN